MSGSSPEDSTPGQETAGAPSGEKSSETSPDPASPPASSSSPSSPPSISPTPSSSDNSSSSRPATVGGSETSESRRGSWSLSPRSNPSVGASPEASLSQAPSSPKLIHTAGSSVPDDGSGQQPFLTLPVPQTAATRCSPVPLSYPNVDPHAPQTPEMTSCGLRLPTPTYRGSGMFL